MPDFILHIDLPCQAVRNPRTLKVALAFELADLDQSTRLSVLTPTTVQLGPGQLAYLVGASGSGKSLVLADLARQWPGPVVAGCLGGSSGRSNRRPVLDVLGLPIERSLRLLCQAGLAEARLWLMPPHCLSAGQADRLTLARLYAAAERAAERRTRGRRDAGTPGGRIERASGRVGDGAMENQTPGRGDGCPGTRGGGDGCLLLIDEFGSRLDRLTARVLAVNLRRWLDKTPAAAAVVATAHDDLADALQPDWLWIKTAEGKLTTTRARRGE